ncbi:MAG TPA: GNAT family N-acetyltransferase [Gemmatimonadales bacterium]|nr:GNAT family N-acetyltransferase [Gemmatimonadales bacterium]
MADMQIRLATRADKTSLLKLIDAHADFEQMPRPTPEARERLMRHGFGDRRRFSPFIASMDGKDIGYAITYEGYSSFLARPTLYLEDIFVYKDARGKGFGGKMFQFLVEEAVDRGCARMEWMVVDWNENAIGFYERRGAEQLAEWHSYRLEEEQLKKLAAVGSSDGSSARDESTAATAEGMSSSKA